MSGRNATREGWLGTTERALEALFGLIMVLTFTGTLSVWTAGRQDVKEMLIGALGCNLAWGIIDACFYLIGVMAERGRGRQLGKKLQATRDDDSLKQVFDEALPEAIAAHMTAAERAGLRDRLVALPESSRGRILQLADLKAAFSAFLWVFLVTFPVALPFVFIADAPIALRVSNGIAVALMALVGRQIALYAGFNPWRTSLFMVLLGAALVAVTIALGG
jgi:VIT family protein